MKSRLNVRGLFVVGLLLAGYGTTVQGQIQDFAVVDTSSLLRFGPTNPANGYPMWVEAKDLRQDPWVDATILLELCEDTNDVTPPDTAIGELGLAATPCPACVDPLLDLPIPGQPQVFPTNYPDEHFYWLGESLIIEADNTRSIVVLALEAAFDGLGAVVDGEQVVFSRYRVRVDNATPGELYQITYPYGVTYVEAENDQGGAAISNINFTNDIFLWKGTTLSLSGIMGSFLTSVNPPPPPGASPAPLLGPQNLFTYLADFCGGGDIEGGPSGIGADGGPANFFRVIGPDAGMVLSTGNTQPSVSQCVGFPWLPGSETDLAFAAFDAYILANVDPLATPLARTPANCARSDEFVGIAKVATKLGVQIDRATYNRSTMAGANSTQINVWASSFEGQDMQLTIPGIVGDIQMCGDGTGNYFAHVLMPSSFIPPTDVTVTNITDIPPTASTHSLSANIVIQSAIANLGTGLLDINATVADPLQTASLSTGGSSMATGIASLGLPAGSAPSLPAGTCGAVPPRAISVASGQGGLVTAPTQIVGVVPELFAAAGGVVVVGLNAPATLDGSASIHGAGTTFAWTQDTGTPVVLSDPTAVSPAFTFPAASDLLTFTLTITDSFGMTSTDSAIVTNTVFAVAGLDQDFSPLVDGGNGLGFPDTGVALDASQSSGAGLSYSWAQITTDPALTLCAGVTLDAPASVAIDPLNSKLATLTMPLVGGCVTLELTISGPGGTSSDSLTIKAPVGAPVANAGTDIVVFANELVQLDASASAGIIGVGGFAWTQVDALGATIPFTVALGTLTSTGLSIDPLGPPNISMPAFVFPATPQTLIFQVVVSGPGGDTSDIVEVIVSDPGTADELTPGRARYDGGKERFSVGGTSSVPGPGHSVTCWFGSPTTGIEIGTGAVDAIADWDIDAIGVLNPCALDPGVAADCDSGTPTIQVHCISTLGGVVIMDYEVRK